jgi:hypothetical protein
MSLPPDLRFDFAPEHPELEISRIILQHQGAESPITIEAIAQQLWPREWWFVRGESHGFPIYPYRAKIQRAIKAAVRKLRRAGRKIGSARGKQAGYYMITSTSDLARTVRPLLEQAIDELRTIEALTGKGHYVAELEGQLRLL